MLRDGYTHRQVGLQSITRVWVFSLLKVLQARGCTLKYKNYLKVILFGLHKKYGNLDVVFQNFYRSLFFPFSFRIRAVAGKKVLIPILLQKKKEVLALVKVIKGVLKNRGEKRFTEKLFQELVEIGVEKGLTKKKIVQCYSDLRKNFVNLRYLHSGR